MAFFAMPTAGCGNNADAPGKDTASGTTTAVRTGASTTPGDPCSLYGSWNTISQPWNNMSTASVITFGENGLFAGVPAYSGNFSFDGTTLVIWNTEGQNMKCSYESKWVVQVDATCTTLTLALQSDGCTGARRYLHGNVNLVRY